MPKSEITFTKTLVWVCLFQWAMFFASPCAASDSVHWYFLDDPAGELSPEKALHEIVKTRSEQPALPSLSRGFTRSTSWLLTDVPQKEQPLSIHFRPGYLQDLKVYSIKNDALQEIFNSAINDQAPPHFVVNLGELSDRPQALLVRLKTNSSHGLLADWINDDELPEFRQSSAIKMSVYLAMIGGAALLFALLGIRLLALPYIVYAIYLVSIGVMTINQQGFAPWLNAGNSSVSFPWVGVAVGASFFSMGLFLKLFFALDRKITPKSYALIVSLIGVGGVTALASATDWYVFLAPLCYWLGYIVVINAMYLAYVSPSSGNEVKGRVFFLAFAQSCAAAFITMATLNNWLPMTNAGLYAYSISVVLQAMLFLLGFVERLVFAEGKALKAAKFAETRALEIADEMTREVLASSEKLQASLDREQQLRQSHEHFISTVNHEYRTPLSIIKGNLDMMKLRLPEMEEYSEKIDRAMSRLQQLFERTLRGYVQMSADQVQLEPVDIIDFLKDVIKSALISVRVDVHFPEGAIPIKTDTSLLRTAVLNLLDNADKYGYAAEGKAAIEVSVSQEGDLVAIRIANKYDPNSPKPSSSLFLPYVRGNKQAGISGLGFGLYLVKSNIEKIGGKIRLLPSKTNTFAVLIELPRAF